MMSSTSPPEQKARPLPVSRMERTPGSLSSWRNALRSSPYTSKVSALRRSGRASVSVTTPVAASSS
jgi:hypothetical protein